MKSSDGKHRERPAVAGGHRERNKCNVFAVTGRHPTSSTAELLQGTRRRMGQRASPKDWEGRRVKEMTKGLGSKSSTTDAGLQAAELRTMKTRTLSLAAVPGME